MKMTNKFYIDSKEMKRVSVFFIRHKEYLPTVIALVLWGLFGLCHYLFGWAIIPFGYLTSLTFAMIGVQLFTGSILFWMGIAFPIERKRLDHETDETKLSEWEITKKALCLFIALLIASVWLANKF
jgi:hypothetical protein